MNKLICTILAGLFVTSVAFADIDLPAAKPVTSTEILVCEKHNPVILVIVVSYPDGSVIRFDAKHMHGLTADQLQNYGSQAKDTFTEGESCGDAI